jgi:hypothetical protein
VNWDGNVKAFGATGDGTTDDTTSINSALAAVGQAGVAGGSLRRVWLPPGNYRTTAPIVLDNAQGDTDEQRHTYFEGSAFGAAKITVDHSYNGIIIKSREASVKNLYVESSVARQTLIGSETTVTNGNGIISWRAGPSTHSRVELEKVRVSGQPGSGIVNFDGEIHFYKDVDCNANGRHGIYMGPFVSAGPFVGQMDRARLTLNQLGGLYSEGTLHYIFNNLEAYGNGGFAQVVLTNTTACQIIAPDLENQENKTATRTVTRSDLTFDASGKTITSAAYDFEANGWEVGEWLLVTASASNDLAFEIASISGSVITVHNAVVDETGTTDVVLTQSTSNWGIRIHGQKNTILGGHYSSLVGGIYVGFHSDAFIVHPRIFNPSANFDMPNGIYFETNGRGSQVYGGFASQTRVKNRFRDQSSAQNNTYWIGSTNMMNMTVVGAMSVQGALTAPTLSGNVDHTGALTSSGAASIGGQLSVIGNGTVRVANNNTADTSKTALIVTPSYGATNNLTVLRATTGNGSRTVNIGGSTGTGVPAIQTKLWAGTGDVNATGTELLRVTASGVRIENGIAGDPPSGSVLTVYSTTEPARPWPFVTEAQKNAMVSPIHGGAVYQQDGLRGFYWYDLTGSTWVGPNTMWDGSSWQPVTVGAADSAGTGFRLLRIPN